MGKINVLDVNIANMIAAGEVVERPASVVKELLENSIDAHAKNITVEIKHGGMTYIRVTDDGDGIEADDVRTAFLPHATSKIKTSEDLSKIYTLGFRGEALASIGAVAKVEIYTKTKNAPLGKMLAIEGGTVTEESEAGCSDGTTIIVRNLFYNTPARMKFLKKDATETGYVSDVINKAVLGNPGVSIKYIGATKSLSSPGDGQLKSSIFSVYGKDYLKNVIPVSYEGENIKIEGFIGNSSLSKKNRSYQTFYINGRNILSKTMSAALSEAFKNTVMVGQFPFAVLNVTLNPVFVDVNVHPTKMEVRFSDDKKIFDAVYWACKNALGEKKHIPEMEFSHPVKKAEFKNAINPKNVKQEEINLLKDSYIKGASSYESGKTSAGGKTSNIGSESQKPITKEEPFTKDKFFTKESFFGKEPISERESISKAENITEKEIVSVKENFTKKEGISENEKVFEKKNPFTKENLFTKESLFGKSENAEEISPSFNDNLSQKNTENDAFVRNADEKTGFSESTANENDTIRANASFRVVGQIFSTYIIVEKNGEMIIIDQHAAHERLYFEEFLKDLKEGKTYSQMMLVPMTVDLSPIEFATFSQNKDFFAKIGFDIDEFGNNVVIIRSVPETLIDINLKDLLTELIENVSKTNGKTHTDTELAALHTMACKRALKGNQTLTMAEMEELVKRVEGLDAINTCPHGRPIEIKMTKKELEKNFKRIV